MGGGAVRQRNENRTREDVKGNDDLIAYRSSNNCYEGYLGICCGETSSECLKMCRNPAKSEHVEFKSGTKMRM